MKLNYGDPGRDRRGSDTANGHRRKGSRKGLIAGAGLLMAFSSVPALVCNASAKGPKPADSAPAQREDAEQPPKKPAPPSAAPENKPSSDPERGTIVLDTVDSNILELGPDRKPGTRSARQQAGVVRHNIHTRPFSLKMRSEYDDPALAATSHHADISGKRRKIHLNHNWDLGGSVYVNEASHAVFGSVRYRDLAKLDAGNMWFGEQAAPFMRLLFRPELNVWRFKGAYYGSVAGVGYLPDSFYTSHSLGLGFNYPFKLDSSNKSRRLITRLGMVGGFAMSMPNFQDMYYNLITGASLQLTGYPNKRFDYMLYGLTTFFAAAADPMKTAYAGYYEPRFQHAEIGGQARIFDDYTLRFFGNVGGLMDRIGFRGTWTVDFSKKVGADLWLGLGATHWSDHIGGRWDPMVMVGATVVIGSSKGINSTNTTRYEHLQSGGVRYAETSLPTRENPGPYSFGRSGDPDVDTLINEAKRRITSTASFDDFVASYNDASQDDVFAAARFLGAFLQQVAYAHKVKDDLYNTNVFSSEVIRVASATNQTMYDYMKEYVQWYQTHNSGDQMPERLQKGIAICSGIHWLMASFLHANGVPSLVASVNTPKGPHMVTIAMTKDRTRILDYGNVYGTEANTLDEAIRFYGRNRGAPTFQSQLYRAGGSYLGTYTTSEGRLLHGTIGIENEDILRREFLGVR
jgi:hypothetical protein